jgi:membrane protease YdiL (CAAX protease family)
MKNSRSTSQLFNFAQDSYLERTSRPIYATIFLLPFIVFYEIGTILINTDTLNQSQVRVVAFVWLLNLFEYLGIDSKVAWAAPPLAVVIILAALQLTSGKRWHFGLRAVWPMTIECILLAIPLIVLSLFLNGSARPGADMNQFANSAMRAQTEAVTSCSLAATVSLPTALAAGHGGQPATEQSLLANIITGIGAGIYEELIFRLILICLLMVLLQDVLQLSHNVAIIVAVFVSAGLFSAHHHIVFLDGQFGQSTPFNWTEFSFRTIAGVYFAILFAMRGFGITAGTHVFYDIIAVFINASFFRQ